MTSSAVDRRRFLFGNLRVTVEERGRGRPRWSTDYHSKYWVKVIGPNAAEIEDIYWREKPSEHLAVAQDMIDDLHEAHFYPDDYERDFLFEDMTDKERRQVLKWARAFTREAHKFDGEDLKDASRGNPSGPREWMPA